MRDHYGALTPHNPEGQQTPHVAVRRQALEEQYVQARDAAIDRDPDLWVDPETQPDIIEGTLGSTFRDSAMQIIRNHRG